MCRSRLLMVGGGHVDVDLRPEVVERTLAEGSRAYVYIEHMGEGRPVGLMLETHFVELGNVRVQQHLICAIVPIDEGGR